MLKYSRSLLLIYALSNAVLYSMLLPLWEGFDEPFHFGYVQYLASEHKFPDPRTTSLSEEVGQSLLLAPASVAVKRNLPNVTTYPQFFSWPEARRQSAHDQLYAIDPALRNQPSQFSCYEGQQAPLSYIVLAFPERMLAALPLPSRVLILRIIASSLGALLLFLAAEQLCTQLAVAEPYKSIAIFCAFSSQMTWATLAHITNDWLAVPLTVWVAVAVIYYDEAPALRRAVLAGIVLSAGLLTKAYIIAFIPVAAAVVGGYHRRWRDCIVMLLVICGLAGPWYTRNVYRYGTLTGMQELRKGADPLSAVRDIQIAKIPAAIEAYSRSALWTANNTYRTFSIHTLRALLVIWVGALLLWLRIQHRRAEWIVALHCFLFMLALAYETAVNYAFSQGEATSPAAWHMQALLMPLLALALLGASRTKRVGAPIAVLMTLLFGYVLIATYWVKLLPLYSGFEGRTALTAIGVLYSERLRELIAGLNAVCLAPANVVLWTSSLVACFTASLQFLLIRQIALSAKPSSGNVASNVSRNAKPEAGYAG